MEHSLLDLYWSALANTTPSTPTADIPAPLAAPCTHPGCTNPRRPGSGSRCCVDHATMIDGVTRPRPTNTATCELCATTWDRPLGGIPPNVLLCPTCRHTHGNLLNQWIKHGVTIDLARTWLTDPHCHVCLQPVELIDTWHTPKAHVDHDHRHTAHRPDYGCARCTRGLTHQRCNVLLGAIDQLLDLLGDTDFDRLIADVRRVRDSL